MSNVPPSCPSVERRMLEDRVPAYQVVRELGRGGMGVVFLVRDVLLHRLLAIKVLRDELSSCPEQRERFRREARMTARLCDRGIVAVHGFGEESDLAYIVMEYVRGEPLSRQLLRDGQTHPLPAEEARRILIALAETLDHAHSRGVVHRDLKPDNVILEHGTGRPILTDFGVAFSMSADPIRSESARAFGTPQFMSPEQALGELDLDGRSDVYSLGVLGFLMLTGKLPFSATHFRELASKHLVEVPVSARKLAPSVPSDLASSIAKCLAKDPTDRFSSAGSLAEALRSGRTRRNAVTMVSRVSRVAALGSLVAGLAWRQLI